MKIIIIGGNGILGTEITQLLSKKHEVLVAGRHESDLICDMESEDSLHAMFKKVGAVDAVVIAAGGGPFRPLDQLTSDDFHKTIHSKLLGQINTVLVGRKYVNPRGSFTLTSGIAGEKPVKQTATWATANSGIEGFVRASSLELPQRINCISPTLVTESTKELGFLFPGIKTLPASEVAKFYQKSVEGSDNGTVFHAW